MLGSTRKGRFLMASQTTSVSQFARDVFCLFVHGFILVMGLELLEEAQFIGKLTESTVRAGVWGLLAGYYVYRTHTTFRSRPVLVAACVFAFFSTGGFVLGVVDDIRWFDTIPLLGRSGAYHGVPQKLCFCIWSCSIARLFYLLLRGLEENQAETDKLRSELAHITRVTALGELAGGIAHELNQPLSAISNFAAAARIMMDRNPEAREQICGLLDEIATQAQRSGHIISKLRAMAEPSPETHVRISANKLVTDIVGLMRPDLRNNDVTIQIELCSSDPRVVVDAVQIQQVLLNLIRNAIDAMSDQTAESRDLQISVQATADEWVEIAVTDSGPGITADMIENLFEPFITTKKGGMGIGLSISRSIIEAHGGTISYDADFTPGTRFLLRLPLVRMPVPQPHFQKPSATQPVTTDPDRPASSLP